MFFNSLSLVALNFEHDIESVVEIQKGVALACDLEILTEEMKKFFDQNQEYVNQQFLHYSYDDNEVFLVEVRINRS